MSRSNVTIRDVAAESGVSYQTVSRVINNNEHVSPATRALVEKAILALDYRPSAIARSMVRGRTFTLACLSPNLIDFTFASIIDGAEFEARKHDYILASSSAPSEKTFARLVDRYVASRRADGLLVINPYIDCRTNLLPRDFPVVIIGSRSQLDGVSSISLDDKKVALDATQYLVSLGHQKIAMITGPMEEDCSRDRYTGYKDALQASGITFDASLTYQGNWSASSGYDSLFQLAENGNHPTAVFAQNDRMAIGVLRAAREIGIDVPGQLSVIGVDDMPLSSYFDPPLSTMRQDIHLIGCQATRMLIESIDNPNHLVEHVYVSAQLVTRNSTCPKM